MKFIATLMAAASIATFADAHGYFVSPKARAPGPVFQKACGMQAFYQMSGDINGNIQGLQQTTKGQSDYNAAACNLWKCKGMKYDDNTANVQKYTPGQSIPMYFDIRAPHDGIANVTVIDLSTPHGKVLASLKTWDAYALTSKPSDDTEEHFSIKMPTTLGGKCAKKGACAIQMHWDARSIDQTYQSCIDFTLAAPAKRDHVRDFSAREVEE
ncbi:hypothetical protein LTR17_005142 [Elasticomyces elasticus]|nr:hypothetical protein LTR17_005142 [Elasticomyces elasticus]